MSEINSKPVPKSAYPLLLDLINETYLDGMDSIQEATSDDDGSIRGIAIDEGNSFVFEYVDDHLEVRLAIEGESKTAKFAAGKARNCKAGISCGNSCISKSKTCRKKASSSQQEKAKEITALVHVPGKGSSPAVKADSASKNTMSPKDMKAAIHKRFRVEPGQAIINNKNFRMATDGMKTSDGKKFSMNNPVHLEDAHRKFVGVLPGEESEVGYGKVGRYFKPWQTFGLDPNTATKEDIKKAYGTLSKKFHPDNKETGDSEKFQAIHTMYKSLSATPPAPKNKSKKAKK